MKQQAEARARRLQTEQESNPLESESYKTFKQQFRGEVDEDEALDNNSMREALLSILDMSVSSQFFDSESDELRINTLDLISFTSTEFEIQITFKSTAYISQSLTNPDVVTIKFKKSDLFVDADSYMTLEPNFVMQVSLPPQVTLEEAA